MKKTGNIIYIVVCLLFCALPLVGMTFYKTDTTTENKTLAAFPKWEKNGKWNSDYFDELSAYFNDHFAFRQELVSVDAEIQSKVFQVSNVDTVMVGTDGWLYYTDTLDDYLGQNIMSDRQVFNTVNNIRLLQQYVEEQGAKFVLTVAPNKNSLYRGNMPYYAQSKVSDTNNMDLLSPQLLQEEISYVDLFKVFEDYNETLYLKRDSHWNNKGAILAYDTLLDQLMIEHETFEDVKIIREKTEYGDLNKMLYPLTAKAEWNYYPQYTKEWSYVSEEENVEAAWIETECEEGTGSLLMFRDSFGNTLLPLMAQQFQKAYFSKGTPYQIADYMEQYQPELVIVEKVERNMDEYMLEPPIMRGPEIDILPDDAVENIKKNSVSVNIAECMEDTDYMVISGEIDASLVDRDGPIYVGVLEDGASASEVYYEAFTVTTETSDYGYRLYLPKEDMISLGIMTGDAVRIDIIVGNDDKIELVGQQTVTP